MRNKALRNFAVRVFSSVNGFCFVLNLGEETPSELKRTLTGADTAGGFMLKNFSFISYRP